MLHVEMIFQFSSFLTREVKLSKIILPIVSEVYYTSWFHPSKDLINHFLVVFWTDCAKNKNESDNISWRIEWFRNWIVHQILNFCNNSFWIVRFCFLDPFNRFRREITDVELLNRWVLRHERIYCVSNTTSKFTHNIWFVFIFFSSHCNELWEFFVQIVTIMEKSKLMIFIEFIPLFICMSFRFLIGSII